MDDGSNTNRAPEPSRERAIPKRPWYLILALGVCFILGASSAFNGMAMIDLYRRPEADLSGQFDDVKDEAQRQKLVKATQALLDAVSAEQSRLFPISAAELVLGLALFLLSVLAMAGRNGARSALVQVVMVSTALAVGEHFAAPKVRAAESDFTLAKTESDLVASGFDAQTVAFQMETQKRLLPFVLPLRLVLRGTVALLIVLALTRRRTRAFYDFMSEERNLESGS